MPARKSKSKSRSEPNTYFLNACKGGICNINVVPTEVDKVFKYVSSLPAHKRNLESTLEQMMDRPQLEKLFAAYSDISFPGMSTGRNRTVRRKKGKGGGKGGKRRNGTVRRSQTIDLDA
jgi:hypothetical protein